MDLAYHLAEGKERERGKEGGGEREREREEGGGEGDGEGERWGGNWLETLRRAVKMERERRGTKEMHCYIVNELILELLCGGCPLNSTMCYAVRSIPML